MCLAIPGEIVEVADDPLRTGRVSFDGIIKQVSLVYVPEAVVGEFVLVHAGFAIARVGEAQARETLAYLARIGEDQP
jgi:hydrogenase expression/formation protein HypC